jgi:hypothetical protein
MTLPNQSKENGQLSVIGHWSSMVACVTLTIALYGWIALRYPLLPGLAEGRSSWATIANGSLLTGLLHGLVYGLLMLCYLLALRATLKAPFRMLHSACCIYIVWLSASLILLFSHPGESLDIFDYLFRGRMQAEYGVSPLAESPTRYAALPFYEYITWRGQVDTYGPVWEYGSRGVAWLVGQLLPRPMPETINSLAAYVLGYRLLAIGVSGLCGVVVYAIVRNQAPALANAALLAWLWNPLQITASAIGAHNDGLMLFWLLASLWLLQQQRWICGLVALVLAAHVKLTALLLAPVIGLWLVRRLGWVQALNRAWIALVVSLPLSWLLYAPLGSWATLPRMLRERMLFLANSPADLLYRWLQAQAHWAEPAAHQVATGGATVLFCTIAGLIMLRVYGVQDLLRLRPDPLPDNRLWWGGAAVTICYLLVGSFWFMPWYGLWALALAALLPASRLLQGIVAALCLGALWAGLLADYLTIGFGNALSPTLVTWVTVACLWLPILFVASTQHAAFLRRPVPHIHYDPSTNN